MAGRARLAVAAVTDVRATLSLLLVVVTALAACTDPTTDLTIPAADPTVFRTSVYPLLLRDCGFPACHGNPNRFFSVFGPGRVRLDPKTGLYDPATPYELAHSYTRARSMLLSPDGPASSLLLRKPIPLAQGGAGHKGNDPWGNTVYPNVDDPRFVVIYRWATAK